MYRISFRLVSLFSCLILISLLSSCQPERLAEPALDTLIADALTDEGEDGHVHYPITGHEAAIIDHVEQHSVHLSQVEALTVERPDGTKEELFLVDGCIEVNKQQLDELEAMVASGEKQYRTYNLVSSPRTISVVGYTGGVYALTQKMKTALSWAINNYNALSTGLSFTLSYAATTNADIVVYRNPYNSGAGGVAGFPSNGNPYKWVQIYSGMENYSTNVNEHVITHEIGHCLGLRHTDYFSRASCGQNTNEGSGNLGAVHIPGTPTGIDWNSVMLACFNSSENGEFGYYDRVALEWMY